MKILIADDHALFRNGLRSFLLGIDLATQAIEADDFNAALACLEEHQDFDLVLTDLSMPGMKGAQGVSCLVQKAAPAPVAVISASEESCMMREVISAGAAGCISKAASPDVLLHALHVILAGGIYLPNRSLLAANEESGDSRLSARQMTILKLLAEGMSNKEVARELGVTEGTVKQHLIAIYAYLGVNSRTRAVVTAQKMGLLD
jgi:DNA-binding NarL/FixJ family response regulator